MKLAGIDLAWRGEKNPSAIAVGSLNGSQLSLEQLEPAIFSLSSVSEFISSVAELSGIAIDAPLIIENKAGQRDCERLLGRDYGSRKASCHTSNKSLYPESLSVNLSSFLELKGFQHLASDKWQIECYPHPAIIECFGLPERLAYKKGKVSSKKSGQVALANYILNLEYSSVLKLKLPEHLKSLLSAHYIHSLKGNALKTNEDALDAIVCLYIAGLYQTKVSGVTYGDFRRGYIWVPQVKCI